MTKLFSNPPTSIGDVLGLTFSIFSSNWKPLIFISVLHCISIFALSISAAFISFFLYAEAMVKVASDLLRQGYYGGDLLDYVPGEASGALQNYYGNANIDDDTGASSDTLRTVSFELIFIGITFTTVLCVVGSIFAGARHHAIAEIYTGGAPSVTRSIDYGWQQKWKICVFLMLKMLIAVLFRVVYIGIPAYTKSETASWLGYIITVIISTTLNAVLIGAVPSIVVENKTPFNALKRSYNLCKDHFWFIYCNLFAASILTLIFTVTVNVIWSKAPIFISMIAHLIINVTMYTFYPILVMVLYMSLRIRSEQFTSQELSDELSSIVPDTNAVEMSDCGNYQAIKGEA